MTYREAMDRFGSDKPDLRFGIELTELTEYFAGTGFRVFQNPYVGAVVMPGGAGQPRKQLDAEQERAGLPAAVGAKPGDCIFFAAGPPNQARALLGAARGEIARRIGAIDEN